MCASSPKPQQIEIYFLCKVVKLQMQFRLPKVFGDTPPETPLYEARKINFVIAQARVIVFFVSVGI